MSGLGSMVVSPSAGPCSRSLRVVPVDGRRGLRRFIRLPWSLYADDPAWVPPLMVERHQHLSPSNPYFAHARCRFWLAYRDAAPVGRISAQIDELHVARYGDATGFFGMLEAEDDADVFSALLSTAETWLRSEGMGRIRGPFNLSINHECGLLVEGFQTPPMIMMGHALPYYAKRLIAQGYDGIKDLLAYRIPADFTPPSVMREILARAAGRVTVRPLRKARLREELKILRDIFEDAWSNNWGFLPFTEAEFAHLGDNLRLFVDEDFVQIAEVEGTPAAMLVVFPNLNEAVRDLNGRLLPFGWLKLLWRLKVAFPKTARIPLMGVRKRYQGTLLGAALAFLVIDAVRAPGARRGVREVDLSWILEDNVGMRNMLEAIGGLLYKRYRIYEKELS